MPGPRSSLVFLVPALVTLVLALLQGDTGWAIVGGCFTVSAAAALWRWYTLIGSGQVPMV